MPLLLGGPGPLALFVGVRVSVRDRGRRTSTHTCIQGRVGMHAV